MDKNAEWFVEQVGLFAETDGFPRIAGRLFALLVLSPGPRSLDDLADALQVSKGSVSVDARRLRQHGVLERIGRPGDRRDYYQIAPDFFGRLIEYRVARWAGLHELVVSARRRLPNPPAAVRDRLRYVDDVHDFVLMRIEGALEDWRTHAGRGLAASGRRPSDARGRTGSARSLKRAHGSAVEGRVAVRRARREA